MNKNKTACAWENPILTNIERIPLEHITKKIDELTNRDMLDDKERYLLYWIDKARHGDDTYAHLILRGFVIAHYDSIGQYEKAIAHAKACLEILDNDSMEPSMFTGSMYVDCAEAYRLAEDYSKALELYEKANEIYQRSRFVDPVEMGALYNSMGSVYIRTGVYDKAHEYFSRALDIYRTVSDSGPLQATTYINMASAKKEQCETPEQGKAAVEEYLKRAYFLLRDTEAPKDIEYAEICGNCATMYTMCGYPDEAMELRMIAATTREHIRSQAAETSAAV